MVIGDFGKKCESDSAWSRTMRDSYLVKYYQLKAHDKYIFIDDKSICSNVLQTRLAVDTLYIATDGRLHYVEEKIERWPGYERSNFALETESCTTPGREKDGWMRYAKSDLLLYGFALEDEQGLDLYELQFQPLRDWFEYVDKSNYQQHTMNTLNHTRFWKVPIKDVLQAPGILPIRYIITNDGIAKLPLYANRLIIKQYREKLYQDAMWLELESIQDALRAQNEMSLDGL